MNEKKIRNTVRTRENSNHIEGLLLGRHLLKSLNSSKIAIQVVDIFVAAVILYSATVQVKQIICAYLNPKLN